MSLIVAKIGLVGSSGIGKTSFMNHIIEKAGKKPKDFYNYNQPTIGVDFNIKPFVYKNNNINWNIYDTAGQERFSPIIRSYYRLCNIIILGFSDEESYNNLNYWLDQIKSNNDKCKIFLVRFKSDINPTRSNNINYNQRLKLEDYNIINISVKKNQGVKELINIINEYIYQNQDKMIKRENIDIEKNNLKSKCC